MSTHVYPGLVMIILKNCVGCSRNRDEHVSPEKILARRIGTVPEVVKVE